MRKNAYTCLVGLLLLTGCQWNLDKMLFDSPCVKPSATIQVQSNQLTITTSLAGKTGEVKTATWDFGDNSAVQTGETATHSYTAIGTYTIKLVLTNRCNDRVEIATSTTVDQQVPPQLETLDPASIATDKATLGLRFTSLGRSMTITEFGYCYSDTKPLPTVDDNAKPLSGTATLSTTYTAVQTGLTAGTVYTVRAYCKTDKTVPQYGLPKSFTIATPVAVAPVVETGAAESVASTSAVLKMMLKSFTSPLYRVGVCYSKNSNPDPGTDKIMFIQETSPALKEYTFTTTDKATDPVNYATPLEPNTTYYYRAFGVTQQVNNVLGTEKLALGTISTFKTLTSTKTNTFLPNVVIYAGNDNGKVYAYSSDGKTQIWVHSLTSVSNGSDPVTSSLTYANGLVYAAARSSKTLFALHADTGNSEWSFVTNGEIQSSPTVAKPTGASNTILYVADMTGKLYLLNPDTGAKLADGNKAVGAIRSSPAVSGAYVCFGSDDNNVYGFNALDGTYKWTFSTTGMVRSSPTIVGDVVYVGSGDKSLYAINLSTGTIKWKYTTTGAVDSSPTVVNGIVYMGSRDHYVYAVNTADGSLKWKSKVAAGDEIFSSPSVSNNLVVVGADDRKLYLFNQADGTLSATFDDASKAVASGAYVSSSPVIYDGTIYFGFADFNSPTGAQNKSAFYGIELNGKNVKMNFPQTTAFWASPLVVKDGVVVGAYPSISGAAQ